MEKRDQCAVFGECVGSCEDKRAEPGRSTFVFEPSTLRMNHGTKEHQKVLLVHEPCTWHGAKEDVAGVSRENRDGWQDHQTPKKA
ncbi:uncharacterized protein LOC133563715 isoform X2 [Nerophis ophidion]|uniref:uncharacterized protein LOC133563715 isoform X2 n=1 Tax=Nerophis ophidion TaxID=159077 RepID=UPI002ADF58AE|nr:uncharacterized protein LOC133563715 isoform X2 [Nerophis ophidion]